MRSEDIAKAREIITKIASGIYSDDLAAKIALQNWSLSLDEIERLCLANNEYKRQTDLLVAAQEARLDNGDYPDDARVYLLGKHINAISDKMKKGF